MLGKIKSLGTDTLIYGISTIIGRFIGFILVPIYTHALEPNEYGIVAIIFSYIAILNIFYSYGMESSFFRFSSNLEEGDPKIKFSTPLISVLITSIIFSLILIFGSQTFSKIIGVDNNKLIIISSGIIFFDTLTIIPFASLRLKKQSKKFVTVKLINIISNVILNLYTLFILKLGVEGIFYSNLISSFISFLILIFEIKSSFKPVFSTKLLKEMLRFGLPYIPVGVSAMVLQVVDRPILKLFLNDSSVGIYQANFRIGVIMNLFTLMFEYAWRPFYLNHAKDLNAKKIFARVFTYYLIISFFVLIFFTFFIKDLVAIKIFGRTIISEKYYDGLNLIPIVLMGYLFSGCAINFNAGIQIMKKTKSLIWTSALGAIISILSNFILIPKIGISGAAISFLIGTFVSMIGVFYVSQKSYQIDYEYLRIIKIIIYSFLTLFVFYYFSLESVAMRFMFLLIWLLLIFKIFYPEEVLSIKKYFRLLDN